VLGRVADAESDRSGGYGRAISYYADNLDEVYAEESEEMI
jgi:hypothetical protein